MIGAWWQRHAQIGPGETAEISIYDKHRCSSRFHPVMLLKHAWFVTLALIATKLTWASEVEVDAMTGLVHEYGPLLQDYLAASRLGYLSPDAVGEIESIRQRVILALEADKVAGRVLADTAGVIEHALKEAAAGKAIEATKELIKFTTEHEGDRNFITDLIVSLVVESNLPLDEIGEDVTIPEEINEKSKDRRKLQEDFEAAHHEALRTENLKEMAEYLCGVTDHYARQFGSNIVVELNRALCDFAYSPEDGLNNFISPALTFCKRVGPSSQACQDVRSATQRLVRKVYPDAESREDQINHFSGKLKEHFIELLGPERAEMEEPFQVSPLMTSLGAEKEASLRQIIGNIKGLFDEWRDTALTQTQYEQLDKLLNDYEGLPETGEGNDEPTIEQVRSAQPEELLLLAIRKALQRPGGGAKYICSVNLADEAIKNSCAETVDQVIKMENLKTVGELRDFLNEVGTDAAKLVVESLDAFLEEARTRGAAREGPEVEDDLADVGTSPSSFVGSSEAVGGTTVSLAPEAATTSVQSGPMAAAAARGTALVEATRKLADAIKAGTPIALDAFTADELIVLSNDKAQCLLLMQSVQPETVHAKKDFLQGSVCKGLHAAEAITSLSDGPLKKAWSEVCRVGGSNSLVWIITFVVALVLVGAAIGGIIFMRG